MHPKWVGYRAFGSQRAKAIDGGVQGVRIELDRGRGRHDEGARAGIELAIGQAEGVAGETAAAGRVPDRVVMARMAGGVQAGQDTAGQVHFVAVGSLDHALGRDRPQATVVALHDVLAVHLAGTGPQLRRVDHVPRAARMHHQARIGQLRHQLARAAGMVQVHVGENQPVHGPRFQSGVGECMQQSRDRMIGPAVDEGGPVLFHHQVGGVEVRPVESGIDGVNAVHGLHRGSRHGQRPTVTQSRVPFPPAG